MQDFDIVRKSQPKETFRVKSVMGSYDMTSSATEEHFSGSIDLPAEWNIGLIVGRSGSGKTTIANELFGNNIIRGYEYTHESILDDMPKQASVSDITNALTSVGFASPPSWLKPYSALSNGEKMRCDLARAMLGKPELFVFDEFTSVVDRSVAKIGSFAMQKAIRRNGNKFVAVTCHYDVQEWLMPDWVFNTDTMCFSKLDFEKQKKNRPGIELDIYETKHKQQYWDIFSKYHYLTHGFNKSARTFVAFANGHLCAFIAMLPTPNRYRKHLWRVHRVVVFSDYQGVGIATHLLEKVCGYFNSIGLEVAIITSNIAMVYGLKKNRNWACKNVGRILSKEPIWKGNSMNRITASFEYVANKS